MDGDKTFSGGTYALERYLARLPTSMLPNLLPCFPCNAGTHYINRIFPNYNPASGVYPNWRSVRIIGGATLTVDEWDKDTGTLTPQE